MEFVGVRCTHTYTDAQPWPMAWEHTHNRLDATIDFVFSLSLSLIHTGASCSIQRERGGKQQHTIRLETESMACVPNAHSPNTNKQHRRRERASIFIHTTATTTNLYHYVTDRSASASTSTSIFAPKRKWKENEEKILTVRRRFANDNAEN